MKKYKSYLFSAILIALMLWASSCVSIREAVEFYEVIDNCPRYESDGYHTTICYDESFVI